VACATFIGVFLRWMSEGWLSMMTARGVGNVHRRFFGAH
jgi:hypothetical protein